MTWGIWARRSAGSIFGAAEAWLKSDGKLMTFDTYEEAHMEAKSLMEKSCTGNVSYSAKPMEQELNETQSSSMNIKL